MTETLTFGQTGFADNPAVELERVYQQILEQRMEGLPVVNPALKVEAIGFQEWEGHWLGVLVTPWFINLLVMRKQGSPWPELKEGKGNDVVLRFPQGEYKFSPRQEEELGSFLSCSLASPVHEWKSHAEARHTAQEVMRLIKLLPVAQLDDSGGCGQAGSDCNLSRRGFLSGAASV